MSTGTSCAVAPDYLDVSEVAGEPISGEQLERLEHRYLWAAKFCGQRDVAEVACGSGPGLGVLAKVSGSLQAGDFSHAMVRRIQNHYGNRVHVSEFDAQVLPYADRSKDVLIIFEALYYLRDVDAFIRECRRVLRPGGRVLVVTCNKDLYDFNPSPYSHVYLGVVELGSSFGREAFSVECFGHYPITQVSVWQRLLRPVKRFVVASGLMPKTMRGKQLLKRLVFGKPVPMPAEIGESSAPVIEPTPLPAGVPDRSHKVIYCVATLRTA